MRRFFFFFFAVEWVVVAQKVTVVVTTVGAQNSSIRFAWLLATLRTYLSSEYDDLIARLVVTWNTAKPVAARLLRLQERRPRRLVIVETGSSSLNNRWIKTLPFVETDLVLNVDDDVVALRPAIECLVHAAKPGHLVGPYARAIGPFFNYSTDEVVVGRQPRYFFILPRLVLLHRNNMEAYAAADPVLRTFVDQEPAHSDDILLNFVNTFKIRAIPPENSVVDYDRACMGRNKNAVGGLGVMKHRALARTTAARVIGVHFVQRPHLLNMTLKCDLDARSGSAQPPRPIRDFEHKKALASMLVHFPVARHSRHTHSSSSRTPVDLVCDL